MVSVGDVGHPNRVRTEATASLPQWFTHCWSAMVFAVVHGSLKPLLMRQDKVGEALQKLLLGLCCELGLIPGSFWEFVHGHWEMWHLQKLNVAFDIHQRASNWYINT